MDLSVYGDDVPLFPMQAPVSKGSKPAPEFAYDRQVYAAKGYRAGELVRVEIMGESRGVRLAKVFVSPVEYEPSRNRLRVHTDLAFEIRFEGADYEATQARKQRYRSQGFQMPCRIAANAAAMQPKATKAGIAKLEDRPMRYVIVSDPKFKATLQPFIQWKQRQGFVVEAAYTDEERVGRTNESIRAYLKGLYDNASEQNPAPTYVLLVGDIGEVPPFDSKETDRYFQGHVTDLYFVEYTGDRLPEAYVGRFSATQPEELQPQIDKTMYMASLTEEQARFVDTTLLIAGNDTKHNFSHLNPALRYIHAYASAEDGVTSLLYQATESSTAEKEDEIIRLMSSGAGLICYTGHGLETEWEQPHISNYVLRTKIFNKDKYPMIIGNCCLTGGFDLPTSACFGEELLRQPDKGAVVYIGATNSSYFDEDFYWVVG
ncbi:MAG: hypothetical protein K2H70_05300, partial [Bacteroidales bacterium]|nr:hypothetical protein [Bacteroidales bacterium]